ncbi:MAG TPA: IS21-like element helper ATPase IstB [Saprospiraceae bacterium]|nr:IS21-like element helper ATPase IstB [Saprospiraceae bacterium]
MNTEQTLQQLRTLKLQGMATTYKAITDLPAHQQPEAHLVVTQLVESEMHHRQDAKMKFLVRISKLRYEATLEQIICSDKRNISKEQISKLADCSFIRKSENILITGATGAGKSFLACALGHQACSLGYKVTYLNMNRFSERISLSKLDGTFTKLLNYLQKTDLIILDDFGLVPFDQNLRLALLQILEDRYAKNSVIVASQLPIKNWYEYLNDPTIADAILDRLTAKHHRMELKGDSLRRKSSN